MEEEGKITTIEKTPKIQGSRRVERDLLQYPAIAHQKQG